MLCFLAARGVRFQIFCAFSFMICTQGQLQTHTRSNEHEVLPTEAHMSHTIEQNSPARQNQQHNRPSKAVKIARQKSHTSLQLPPTQQYHLNKTAQQGSKISKAEVPLMMTAA
ncbi:hypothetical protein LOK49_LG12G02077 [Camellia lanceoleosa]|uniref:Uncharacterized protein n=1 Tax=Camellia lanceoleosa TaxID=1840588 RepID=A0ACC0FPM9_9ERIC|nr:hypothetical protein LOK49_LG12G02077 [Camellia lanceoleosa]